MRHQKFRVIILFTVLAMAGIAVTQFYWIKKALASEENEFDLRVATSLRNVAESIVKYHYGSSALVNPVLRIEKNQFIAKVNDQIPHDLLAPLLKQEFLTSSITDHYDVLVYDCYGKKIAYQFCSQQKGNHAVTGIPFVYDNYFFSVLFPDRNFALSRMGIWMFSTLMLVLILSFFGYLLYLFFQERKLSEFQKEFVNNMTHEFKTPLTSITLASEIMMKESLGGNERSMTYLSIIQKESSKLGKNVERILQMGHAGRNDLQLKKEKVDVNEILSHAVEKFRHLHESIDIRINLTALDHWITGDLFHLTNVFCNLLDNAIKYSEGMAEIEVRSREWERWLVIEVQDRGVGIPLLYQKEIFSNFFRIPNGNVHAVKGFGVGLYYARKIIEAHGGKILVKSTPGTGSVFSVHLIKQL